MASRSATGSRLTQLAGIYVGSLVRRDRTPHMGVTLRTPGRARRLLLAMVAMRLMAAWEALELPSKRTTRSVSLKSGSRDSWRRSGIVAQCLPRRWHQMHDEARNGSAALPIQRTTR